MRCNECYSEHSRITPLKGAEDCLRRHRQYVCSACGRVVCADLAGEMRARCFMPFSSLETAMLYLKVAEILNNGVCGIYELIYKRGDKRYRIFRNQEEFALFLKKNPGVSCEMGSPVFISENHHPVDDRQIRYLSDEEVLRYMVEMQQVIIK